VVEPSSRQRAVNRTSLTALDIRAGESLFQDAHPHAILFRNNRSDPASMYAMEAYAAYDLATLGQCDTAFALSKRLLSISWINRTLNDPAKIYEDTTVAAVLGAIAVDVQPASVAIRAQHRSEALVHINGVVRLLSRRGGPSGLPHELQIFYHW
jgi:hypothetical protein